MTRSPEILSTLEAAFAGSGILLRGVVQFNAGEGPRLAGGNWARSVVLLGNIGGSVWPAFSKWRAARPDRGGDHPLDAWSKSIVEPVATRLEATAWFPSDPPYMPFQTWAKQAEGLKTSPLGILIHPQAGLWHGYRGALGFSETIETAAIATKLSPCDECNEKPCLSACPVAAVTDGSFDVPACRTHLATTAGKAGCLSGGCIARAACPVGGQYRYGAEQLSFHMAALGV